MKSQGYDLRVGAEEPYTGHVIALDSIGPGRAPARSPSFAFAPTARRPPSLLHSLLNPLAAAVNSEGPSLAPAFIMADDIVIDKQLFHERLSSFVTKWKTDKRAGDQIFQGAGSIATVVGKPSEEGSYLKPAAFQVGCTIIEFQERESDGDAHSYGC